MTPYCKKIHKLLAKISKNESRCSLMTAKTMTLVSEHGKSDATADSDSLDDILARRTPLKLTKDFLRVRDRRCHLPSYFRPDFDRGSHKLRLSLGAKTISLPRSSTDRVKRSEAGIIYPTLLTDPHEIRDFRHDSVWVIYVQRLEIGELLF